MSSRGAAKKFITALHRAAELDSEHYERVAHVFREHPVAEMRNAAVTALIAYFIPLRPREDSFVIGAAYA